MSASVQDLIEMCTSLDKATGLKLKEEFGDFGDRLEHVLDTAPTDKTGVETLRASIGALIKSHKMVSALFLGHDSSAKIARTLCEKAFAKAV